MKIVHHIFSRGRERERVAISVTFIPWKLFWTFHFSSFIVHSPIPRISHCPNSNKRCHTDKISEIKVYFVHFVITLDASIYELFPLLYNLHRTGMELNNCFNFSQSIVSLHSVFFLQNLNCNFSLEKNWCWTKSALASFQKYCPMEEYKVLHK